MRVLFPKPTLAVLDNLSSRIKYGTIGTLKNALYIFVFVSLGACMLQYAWDTQAHSCHSIRRMLRCMHATICMGHLGVCLSWYAWEAQVHACHSMHGRSREGLRRTSPPLLFETWFLTVHHCVSHTNWTTGLRGFSCLCLSCFHRTPGFLMCAMVPSSM